MHVVLACAQMRREIIRSKQQTKVQFSGTKANHDWTLLVSIGEVVLGEGPAEMLLCVLCSSSLVLLSATTTRTDVFQHFIGVYMIDHT